VPARWHFPMLGKPALNECRVFEQRSNCSGTVSLGKKQTGRRGAGGDRSAGRLSAGKPKATCGFMKRLEPGERGQVAAPGWTLSQ